MSPLISNKTISAAEMQKRVGGWIAKLVPHTSDSQTSRPGEAEPTTPNNETEPATEQEEPTDNE